MEKLFVYLNNTVYVIMGILAVWGAYCVVMVWRRLANTSFADESEQEDFLAELEQNLDARNYPAAIDLCEGDRRALPQLALYALNHRDLPPEKLRHRLAERYQEDVLADVEHRLSWVATVIKTAPMIGLLGTVMGMMGAFANLSSGEKVDTIKMASDIQFALITTAIGLSTAIPLMLATANINIRLRKQQDLVGWGLTRMFESMESLLPKG